MVSNLRMNDFMSNPKIYSNFLFHRVIFFDKKDKININEIEFATRSKKMKKIVFISIFFLMLFSGLYAKRNKYPAVKDNNLKRKMMYMLNERRMNIVKKTINNCLDLFGVVELVNKHYKDYKVYQTIINVGIIFRDNFVGKGDSLYLMPGDFNKLLIDSDNIAKNEKEEIEIAKKFVELHGKTDIKIEEAKIEEVKYENHIFKVQVTTWAKINGVRIKWYFIFKDGQIEGLRYKVIDKYVGDFTHDSDYYYYYSKGHSGMTGLETFPVKKEDRSLKRDDRSSFDVLNAFDNLTVSFSDSINEIGYNII